MVARVGDRAWHPIWRGAHMVERRAGQAFSEMLMKAIFTYRTGALSC